jgi:hypothetical protein
LGYRCRAGFVAEVVGDKPIQVKKSWLPFFSKQFQWAQRGALTLSSGGSRLWTRVGVSCLDQLGFLDFLSYGGLCELLTVITQFRMFPYYPAYFFDHRHWDAYALPVVFSSDGSRHFRFKIQQRNLLLTLSGT